MRLPFIMMCLFLLTACVHTQEAVNQQYGNYKGKGGMTAYSISPEAYRYHYDHGFTGVDSMGWDPNLQYVWSRSGAAKACGIPLQQNKVIGELVSVYGHSKFTHELNGIEFHYMQINAQEEGFCTPSRLEELMEVIPQFESGVFPKKF